MSTWVSFTLYSPTKVLNVATQLTEQNLGTHPIVTVLYCYFTEISDYLLSQMNAQKTFQLFLIQYFLKVSFDLRFLHLSGC